MRKPLKTWKSFASLEEAPSTRGQIEVEYKQVAILKTNLTACHNPVIPPHKEER